MYNQTGQIPLSISISEAKIQFYLWQVNNVNNRLLKLRAQKEEFKKRFDALESRLQLLG